MTIHQKLPSDIVGLAHQVGPLSRRGFFMSASAAAAAGYTLAAGPVRAQTITTDTAGLNAGEAKVKVAGGEGIAGSGRRGRTHEEAAPRQRVDLARKTLDIGCELWLCRHRINLQRERHGGR